MPTDQRKIERKALLGDDPDKKYIYKRKFFALFGNKCCYCGTPEQPPSSGDWSVLCLGQYVPRGLGGHLVPGNLVSLCKSCVSKRRNQHPKDFYTTDQLEHIQPLLDKERDIFIGYAPRHIAKPETVPTDKAGWDALFDEIYKAGSKLSVTLEITYHDFGGEQNNRLIDTERYVRSGQNDGYLDAYCRLRHERRTFRLSRVLAARDPSTGEIIQNLPQWLDDRHQKEILGGQPQYDPAETTLVL